MSVYDKPAVDEPFSTPVAPGAGVGPTPAEECPVSAAVQRFRSCRGRKAAENGTPECCGHRDVLPITGTHGFDPEAWCPECAFYKLRRTPKKREYYDERY